MMMALPDVVLNDASHLFSLQVCARRDVERGMIELETERLMPHGRDLGWFLREESQPVNCATHDDRQHWVLT